MPNILELNANTANFLNHYANVGIMGACAINFQTYLKNYSP